MMTGCADSIPCSHGNLHACGLCLSDASQKCKHGNSFFCGLCEAEAAPKCKHGNPFYCGFCESDKTAKCKHGNPFYCGFCWRETGDGRVDGSYDSVASAKARMLPGERVFRVTRAGEFGPAQEGMLFRKGYYINADNAFAAAAKLSLVYPGDKDFDVQAWDDTLPTAMLNASERFSFTPVAREPVCADGYLAIKTAYGLRSAFWAHYPELRKTRTIENGRPTYAPSTIEQFKGFVADRLVSGCITQELADSTIL